MLPSARELNYFHQVAISLNFSHAAKLLNTSQPSLSMAIKRLEKKLNVSLFHRHKTGLTLTTQGIELFNQVKDLMTKWQQIKLSIEEPEETVTGRVTIGCHVQLSYYMADLIAQLDSKYPALEINVYHGLSPQISQGVNLGTIDIGFVHNPVLNSNLIAHDITNMEMSFWARPGFSWHVDDAENHPTIIYDNNHPVSVTLFERYKRKGFQYNKLINVNNYDAICHLILQGCGIGILPECSAIQKQHDTLQRLYQLPYLTSAMKMIYRQQDKNSTTIQTVITELRQYSLDVLDSEIA